MAPGRKAQTRLQFTPLPSSSPQTKEYSPTVHNRLANVRFNASKGQQPPRLDANSIPTPQPSSQPQDEETVANSQNREEDDIESPSLKRRRVGSHRPRQTTLTPRRSSRIQNQAPSTIRPSSSGSSSSSQRFRSVEVPSPTPAGRTRSLRTSNPTVHSSPPPQFLNSISNFGSPETSGDDDDVIATRPGVQRRRTKKSTATKDDFVVPDDETIEPSTEDEVEVKRPAVKQRRSRRSAGDDFVVPDEEGVEILTYDEHPETPLKRRKSSSTNHTPRSRRLKSRREYQELQEDLEDLQDSDSPELQSSRTRGAPVNKARERRREYIDLLKRRRAGEKDPINLDSDEAEEPLDDYTANHSSNVLEAFFDQRQDRYGQETSSDEDGMPQNPDLDVNEDDFVVSDEEEASLSHNGRPHPDIPLQFTSYASAKPRELFVFVIEWLVKNKIAPAFSRHDPLWSLAFTKIKDEITAQAGSRLKSSAWTSPFTNALNARPGLTTKALAPGENFLHGCDACNKTNRPAQYDFVFSGSAYDHDSLEPIDADSEEDQEANDNASLDSRGRPIPSADTHFLLGRYCAANAELAHKLTHWKYNLNESLMQYLESQGVLSAEEILRRERSKGGQRKREKEAEEIVDGMKETGVIEELWKGFKDDLDDARIGMEGYERKGGARGNKRIGSVRVPASDVFKDDEGGGKIGQRNVGAKGSGRETSDMVKNLIKRHQMFASDDEEGE